MGRWPNDRGPAIGRAAIERSRPAFAPPSPPVLAIQRGPRRLSLRLHCPSAGKQATNRREPPTNRRKPPTHRRKQATDRRKPPTRIALIRRGFLRIRPSKKQSGLSPRPHCATPPAGARPAAYLNLVADVMHNFADGLAIGVSVGKVCEGRGGLPQLGEGGMGWRGVAQGQP
jgi:hypothetical protein